MAHFTLRSLAFIGVLLLAGCSGLSDQADETAGWSAQKLYTEAKESMSDGAWDRAIKMFEKLEARYPYGRYAQQSQLEVAYAYYKSGEPASAVAACDRFIKLHPNHPNVDYAYYLKGLAYFNEDLGLLGALANQDMSERDTKASRDAFDTFKDLVTRYPNSVYAADAQARMRYLVNALAAHEVHVARFYLRRGAYVAAANRAQAAVKDFPESPSVEEGLFLMIKAYDAMGLTELRDDADRVLRKNYPNSAFYSGQPRPGEKSAWWKLW
ncbi:MAG TPA: outer membrane protein assembly factor BamD [Zoogloea sp.]|uniref:outer membrane protein assembly factor BamD n=1 Tax=Zoogloea sp. TaxID=49181 RepID=UPI002BCA3912|nr:outer membrane protein assembly factor BamD [Zoogloea sp.]HMV17266.1 outer membrane protein assembly factor BamD [Rhodocyclaceae bacterium]HMV63378.1 outer membrane protein assembly factor BamD [Rhodocyclaceae bacterium]HMW51214.1 outer membrane protein assembly factor BamD [Rhodocyclaceae bacterium]HMY50008.1 outer membrane protein assembly factor BamD [Rhodocyclaceae bacterium]HMZ76379.1 outer membrane protein assembly factor BamD [Rhodocyclaceae bacterium]